MSSYLFLNIYVSSPSPSITNFRLYRYPYQFEVRRSKSDQMDCEKVVTFVGVQAKTKEDFMR